MMRYEYLEEITHYHKRFQAVVKQILKPTVTDPQSREFKLCFAQDEFNVTNTTKD
jgi:hypothetical protein